jgi:DNA-binding MarR family transcriptional regulator
LHALLRSYSVMGIYLLMSEDRHLDSPSQEVADRLLRALLPVEQNLGLPLLLALAAVAREPGLSVNDLADRLAAPQQSASRYIGALQGRYSTPGRDVGPVPLLTIEINPMDPRKRALRLTTAGEATLSRVLETLTPRREEQR